MIILFWLSRYIAFNYFLYYVFPSLMTQLLLLQLLLLLLLLPVLSLLAQPLALGDWVRPILVRLVLLFKITPKLLLLLCTCLLGVRFSSLRAIARSSRLAWFAHFALSRTWDNKTSFLMSTLMICKTENKMTSKFNVKELQNIDFRCD